MASLSKIGKNWYVSYYDASGRKKKIKGFTDKGESQRLAVKLENEKTAIRQGYVDPQQEQAKAQRSKGVADHLAEYVRHLQAKGCSANHIAYTQADIQKCIDHTGAKYASDITKERVDGWVLYLSGDTPRTINRRIGSVQAFLRHLCEQGALGRYPLNKYPKRKVVGTEKRKYRHLGSDEVRKFLAAEIDPQRKFIYRFALLTGFRFNEICSMRPSSFNFDQSTVTVKANDAKNKSKDQTIPLHPHLVSGLKELCAGKDTDERIFDMPSRSRAARQLRADCVTAGVDPKRIVFHSLRHTFITRLAESMIHPKILQTLARHSNIETTLRHYVHFKQADERAAVEGL
ncbi:MAG: site-specific integrase [Phycisphaerales bacterium]|nr:site-specific integrase [Phycisphaerales bacterium]